MKTENSKQLCPICEVGKYSYILDNKNPFCPYLNCHNGKTCSAFKPLENSDGGNDNDNCNN